MKEEDDAILLSWLLAQTDNIIVHSTTISALIISSKKYRVRVHTIEPNANEGSIKGQTLYLNDDEDGFLNVWLFKSLNFFTVQATKNYSVIH